MPLFWNAGEPLRSGALLEEVGHSRETEVSEPNSCSSSCSVSWLWLGHARVLIRPPLVLYHGLDFWFRVTLIPLNSSLSGSLFQQEEKKLNMLSVYIASAPKESISHSYLNTKTCSIQIVLDFKINYDKRCNKNRINLTHILYFVLCSP